MADTLSVFVDSFGTLTGAHFFNSLEVSVARAETSVDGSIKEKSAIAASPLYRQLSETRFEPRHVFCSVRQHSAEHPFQQWLKGGADETPFPAEGFDFARTVTYYKDVIEFPVASEVVIKPERPMCEIQEDFETKIRLALEREDKLAVFNIVQSLDSPFSGLPLDYLLDEAPRKALALVAGVSFPGLGDGSNKSIPFHRDQTKLAALTNYVERYQSLQGRAAKVFLPILCGPDVWDAQKHTSLYERSQVAAVVLDALTLPYRTSPRMSGYAHYGRLVPSTSPLVCCSLSILGDSCLIADVSQLHKHADVARYSGGYPGHSFACLVGRGGQCALAEAEMVTAWRGKEFVSCHFDEPIGLTFSSTYREGAKTDLYYSSVLGCPMWTETWSSREPMTSGVGMMDEGIEWLGAAMKNSNLVPRSNRDERVQVQESLCVIIDELGLLPRHDCIDEDD